MNTNKSGTSLRAKGTGSLRRLTLVGGLMALPLLFAGTQASAAPVHFRYVGGRWGHAYHAGWNRYWGGPSIGFYYAPAPVYVVPGYAAPSYYAGPNFWYSNPSFGLSLNFGGGYYGGGYYGGPRYYRGGGYNGYHGSVYHGGSFNNGFHGQAFHGGGSFGRGGGGRGGRR